MWQQFRRVAPVQHHRKFRQLSRVKKEAGAAAGLRSRCGSRSKGGNKFDGRKGKEKGIFKRI